MKNVWHFPTGNLRMKQCFHKLQTMKLYKLPKLQIQKSGERDHCANQIRIHHGSILIFQIVSCTAPQHGRALLSGALWLVSD